MQNAFIPCLFTIFLLTSTVGCGIRVGEVTGTVTVEGEPAPEGVRVSFTAQGTDVETIYANTGVGGKYQLIHRSGKKGIEPGRYTVSLGFWGDQKAQPPTLQKLKIPAAFFDGTSTLTCDVPGGGIVFDINAE
jgi:hypothetical protein